MAYLPLGNPIWSCQYRLQGGQRLFIKAGAYGLLAVGLIMLYHRLNYPRNAPAVTAASALRVLAWVQVAVLILGGTGAITRTLLRDYTTKMIESHRISPMRSFTVVIGYMFGGTVQILLLYSLGLVLGVALCFIAGSGSGDWLMGNLYLLVVAASIWSIAVFAGVGSGKPGNLAPLIVIAAFTSVALMGVVPGLALFIGAYAVSRCHGFMLGVLGPSSGLGVALAISVLVLVFWSVAAARRYRKPYLPPLNVVMALAFVGFWLLCFLTGLVMHSDLVPGGGLAREMYDEGGGAVFVIALLSPLLVAHLPVAAAVRMRRRRILGAEPHLPSDSWSPALAALLSILLIGVAVAFLVWRAYLDPWKGSHPWGLDAKAWGAVVAALVLAVWTVTGFLRLSQFTIGRTVIATILVVCLWLFPPLIDHARVLLTHGPEHVKIEHYSFLLGCSPISTIINGCKNPTYTAWPGLAFQAAVTLLATLLGNRAERILIHKRARLHAEESQTAALRPEA